MRDELHDHQDKYKINPTVNNKNKLNKFKNRYRQAIRFDKIKANSDYLKFCINNLSNASWSLINSKKTVPSVEKSTIIPNTFNYHFSYVAKNLYKAT